MHSYVTISQADRRPMYLQIIEQIRHRIAVGDWKAGDELPSIRALAISTQVSVITVKRAYLELEREGVIVTRQGKASFVAEQVDLSSQLRREELDQHLAAAAQIGRELALTPEELLEQMRVQMTQSGEKS
jgi:GntR family transcriptional regulator